MEQVILNDQASGIRVTSIAADGSYGTSYLLEYGETKVELKFHSGSPIENGANGLTTEALVSVLIDRLIALNEKVPCKENEYAIGNLDAVLMMMASRNASRKIQSVKDKPTTV